MSRESVVSSSMSFFATLPTMELEFSGYIPVPGRLVVRFSSVNASPFLIFFLATNDFLTTPKFTKIAIFEFIP